MNISAERAVGAIEVILNLGSGLETKSGLAERIQQVLSADGATVALHALHRGDDVEKVARRAANGDSNVIVAAGGDGTISSVAHELVDTDKTLGVIPLGTLNHFAKDLGLPLELDDSLQTIQTGLTSRVDVGQVNGRSFINNSSLGLYPSIVSERVKNQRLGYGKWPAFAWAAFTVLRRYPFLNVRLSADDREFISRTPFVFVGNNEYQMETLHIGAREALDAGQLCLYVTHRTGRLGLLRLAFRAIFGGLRNERDFTAMCSKDIWIETPRRALRVAMDGEVKMMTPPLHYTVKPLALKVIVP